MTCRCCDRFIKSSSLTLSGGNLLIATESTPDLANLNRYCLLITQSLPAGSNTSPVQLQIGGTTYPVYTRSGNLLRADQIRCRKLYCIVYGNDPDHFSLVQCVPNTVYTVSPSA